MQAVLIGYIVMALISFPLAYYLGRERKIGFRWTLFFGTTLTPLIGLIAVFLSKDKELPAKSYSRNKIIIGRVLILLFIFSFFINLKLEQNKTPEGFVNLVMTSAGFIGFGLYLIQQGKGRF